MRRFLFLALVCVISLARARAQEKQLPENCDWDYSTYEITGGEARFDMSFCRLDDEEMYKSRPYITVTTDVRVKDDAGDEITADTYTQHGLHWSLLVVVGAYSDGHRIGIRETEQKVLNSLNKKYTVVTSNSSGNYGEDEHECYARRTLDVLAKNSNGNKVYIRYVIQRNAMMIVNLETFCKNGACDPDDFAHNILARFLGRGFAYRKECGSAPMD